MTLLAFNWGLPENISKLGQGVDSMMSVIHWFMLALFVGWGAFFIYCVVKFRARPGHKAIYEPIHATWSKWLEIGVVVFEAILLVGFSMPVWGSFKRELPKPTDATEVRIVAQQFKFNFWYPGCDGVFGKTAPKFAGGTNYVGLDPDDPAGKDDYVDQGELVFPQEKPVLATISSLDVIHSFGVPALRLKQDAIPGMKIPIWWEATKTGTFDIACSQLCGNGHTAMSAQLHPVTQADFEKWQQEWWDCKATPEATPTSPAPAATTAAPTATPAATTTAAPAATPTAGTH